MIVGFPNDVDFIYSPKASVFTETNELSFFL